MEAKEFRIVFHGLAIDEVKRIRIIGKSLGIGYK